MRCLHSGSMKVVCQVLISILPSFCCQTLTRAVIGEGSNVAPFPWILMQQVSGEPIHKHKAPGLPPPFFPEKKPPETRGKRIRFAKRTTMEKNGEATPGKAKKKNICEPTHPSGISDASGKGSWPVRSLDAELCSKTMRIWLWVKNRYPK